MISRLLGKKIQEALTRSSTIALTGPRQVGKTTLAFAVIDDIPSLYLDLENRVDLQKAGDIETLHAENRKNLIILDEVQRLPEIFPRIRGLIDQERRKGNKAGHFFFLGPASMTLLKQSGESLAGRISYLELFPINLLEYGENDPEKMNRLWLRGGFPESLLADSDETSLAWRIDFIRTYLERDIPQLGPRIPATTLERFWTMLAHNQGGILNASNLARGLEVSSPTVGNYLDLMVDLLLVRRLQPWTSNVGKRLVRSPKVYVRDSGITHALLNISGYNALLGHPVVGGSWEGFVIENILSVIPQRVQPYFYRTTAGSEIDLVLEFPTQEKWAIEIKRNSSPSLSKGFHTACDEIKADRRYVVYAGADRFSMGEGVTAIPLYDLMQLAMKAL
jgi:predicted AAA+ superfamily ATPase